MRTRVSRRRPGPRLRSSRLQKCRSRLDLINNLINNLIIERLCPQEVPGLGSDGGDSEEECEAISVFDEKYAAHFDQYVRDWDEILDQ